MTITTEAPIAGGMLFFRPELVTIRGREISGVAAGCPSCGWTGAPTIVAGEASTFCPSCESDPEVTFTAVHQLRVAEPEDVYGRGPWARLARRGERGELYRPRPARVTYLHQPRRGTTTVRRAGVKVGRNDPCPCGSGRKFKRCCG